MVLAAAKAAADGAGAAEVAGHVAEARRELKMWFAIDTLEFLKRGGRIGAASAWIGSTLKVKPILTVDNEMTPVERVRTAGRAFERMVDYARQRHESGADAWSAQHIAAPDTCARLVERCTEIFGCEPTIVSEIGPVLAAHTGPGLLGVGAVPTRFLAVGAAEGGANTALMMPAAREVVRIVLIVVAVAICLYLIYQVRRPLTWLLISIFLAAALSPPVNWLAQWMRRGFAVTIVYLCLLAVPILLIALIVPTIITEGTSFADNVPQYARDVTNFVQDNQRLREINQDYDITTQARGRGEKAPRSSGRRGHNAPRRRPRHRQLAVRAGHDPGADRLPARERAHAGRIA